MKKFYLHDLPIGTKGIVDYVEDASSTDKIAERLRDLGFVYGESVEVIAFGPLGANPIAVQIGSTRFALRRSEAARVVLRSSI